jgi:hypothetical protein
VNVAKGDKQPDQTDRYVRVHLAFGWWMLAIYTFVGLVLESAHGLKMGWYLDVTAATRRLSLTLGHAHGTLLALVNIAFALSLPRAKLTPVARARASFALRAATIALPLGFLAGGFKFYGGDPGIPIVLVPPSAVLLIIGIVTFARGFQASSER